MLTSRHTRGIVSGAVVALLAFQLSYKDSTAAAATQLSEVEDISHLKDLFIEDTGKVRLLTILSPN